MIPATELECYISIHAPRTGSDRAAWTATRSPGNFNPRSPHGERRRLRRNRECTSNFNPRSPHGERRARTRPSRTSATFQSTLPARGATLYALDSMSSNSIFQSTLPARGATAALTPARGRLHKFQSTLPARGATEGYQKAGRDPAISIHAPRTGSDGSKCGRSVAAVFQSTLPARGATSASTAGDGHTSHFNPRSPHGERRPAPSADQHHQPFQSTLPARGATAEAEKKDQKILISIHAPRTGSDHGNAGKPHRHRHFNPRSPHGERHACGLGAGISGGISIHAPRTGSDPTEMITQKGVKYFNPRSPHGERQRRDCGISGCYHFNPRSPHGERLPSLPTWRWMARISIHAPRTGSDWERVGMGADRTISIHAPRTGSDSAGIVA